MNVSRTHFLKQMATVSLGFMGLKHFWSCSPNRTQRLAQAAEGFGKLIKDPAGILDLPKGFSYQIISQHGDTMDDGLYVPHRPDGMAAFSTSNGFTILVRNHEVNPGADISEGAFGKSMQLLSKLSQTNFYDYGHTQPALGGCTTLIYDTKKKQVVRQFLSLVGTLRNCAGGTTPWHSWLTCEEIIMEPNERYNQFHGYVFEVPATEQPSMAKPIPIKAMGRFNHEAVGVDPNTHIIYLTEDDGEGLLYRYLPNDRNNIHKGGKLQAMMMKDTPQFDSRNWDRTRINMGEKKQIEWIDIDNVDAIDEPLKNQGFRKGAIKFARGEGMWFGNKEVFFVCTNGGKQKIGQIWKYTPSQYEGSDMELDHPGVLELFIESDDSSLLEKGDNITISPWGDLIVCEDTKNEVNMVGVTPQGKLYKFARNVRSSSEFAGACFSPDGSTLFANMQHDGLTLAITGPWGEIKKG